MTLPLTSRIALVTGASRGIGYATARALAKAGAHVVAVARTQAGLEELDDEIRQGGGSATLVPLNLTDFDGIARLGAALHERHGKLDILVGNAGVAGPSSPLGHIELKPWNEVMAVNVTANFQLIRCMEPLLKNSDAGRAVFLTSPRRPKPAPISAPMPPPRQRWRHWRGRGRRKPPAQTCASICSIPARSAPGCAPRCFRAKIR